MFTAWLAVSVLATALLPPLCESLPFFEIDSQSIVQQNLLETRYFSPELYENTDFGGSFDGHSHAASPYNANKDLTISLSQKSFTVEWWLKHNRDDAETFPAYIASQGGTAAEAGERLLIGFKADNTFEMSFYDGNALVTPQHWTGDQGQWHHWAVTYDKESNERVVYRDGVMVASDIAMTPLIATSGLKLGHGYLKDIERDVFFDGVLDEFRIWETVVDVETLQMYASLTSAWVTDFHPNLAYLMAYFDFNEGTGKTSDDSGPIGYNLELECGAYGEACGSGKEWWATGVGRRSLEMGDMYRIHKICPTPALAHLDYNSTFWTYPDYERRGITRPLPYCTTDLQHRHEVICGMEYTLHIAYQRGGIPGFPRHYLCDGIKWMPVFYDHHIWNNFLLPDY